MKKFMQIGKTYRNGRQWAKRTNEHTVIVFLGNIENTISYFQFLSTEWYKQIVKPYLGG